MATTSPTMTGAPAVAESEAPPARKKRKLQFPTAVGTLTLVAVVVWIAVSFIPSGVYQHDEDGAPIPGTFTRIDSPLDFVGRLEQLVFALVNGLFGIQGDEGIGPFESGSLFGAADVFLFVLALGAFLEVTFSTRALETGVGRLAQRLGDRGWLVIVVVMVLFSLLGSTMGFSVETFGFYGLLVPLVIALGYDRMTAIGVIVLSSTAGVAASTVNPFSIGVASAAAGVTLGDGIVVRLVLWVLFTAITVAYVLRYAARVKKDPARSMTPESEITDSEISLAESGPIEPLTGSQKLVLAITAATFGLLVFSVIPWGSLLGAATGPAEYEHQHDVAGVDDPWFQLDWWFPELIMLFFIAAIVVGLVARYDEKKLSGLIVKGAAGMMAPGLVIIIARGITAMLNNTQTIDSVLSAMERAVSGASTGVFATLVAVVGMPLSFLIPSTSGVATLAMPIMAPLGDFAGVGRSLVITAFMTGGAMIMFISPTNIVAVVGIAMAGVKFDKYFKFALPLFGILWAVLAVVLVGAAILS
ncbi:YfcC family protein [Sandaracinus amylolyticus]|uniref:YfcC family protein n=1 Tax=Sandaracinus amylolyticus TaxID=927083 RepID=UPI001F1A0C2B|nr:Na+/H+ antiporter NhaC family protein [Sandaracinus amylolyticus]UJR85755.1 Hypothetical protein I5071_78350 [Sandaracinus amylolyticus]